MISYRLCRAAMGGSAQIRVRAAMAANVLEQRGVAGQRRALSSAGKQGSDGEEKPAKSAAAARSKRSLAFAAGGVLALVGMAGYSFFRQQEGGSTDAAVAVGSAPAQTPLQSVEAKREQAREGLDGLSREERREKVKSLDLLTEEEVDAILAVNEKSWRLDPPAVDGRGALRLRVDTNQVSSNSPIEDYLVWTPLGPEGATRYMFGVLDGHAGYQCAEQLSVRLAPMLSESLDILQQLEGPDNAAGSAGTGTSDEMVKEAQDLVRSPEQEWDQVSLALTATFIRMDQELVHGALAAFQRAPDLSRIDELLGPAVAGSCGLVTVVDTAAREVVVANTGDSRAVLGVRLGDGQWKAVRLSEDQTVKNPSEAARVIGEHPGEEPFVKGRMLGGLMPTRAFGDCRYKWPLEAQQDLFPVLLARGHGYATTPSNYATPPYVTATPVIVKHQLSEGDKFIVIASDGLYDQLSDAEVVDTVAQWFEANAARGAQGADQTLVTKDRNAATHLIRAALSTDSNGNRGDAVIRHLLAIPSPYSRRFRDDISVTVVTLNEE